MAVGEGRLFEFHGDDKIRSELLEVFDFSSPDQRISTRYPEFSCVCPFSGLPDIATVEIDYRPGGGVCVELKSLKYYLTSFRMVGIYQEAVTKRIFDDLRSVLGLDQGLIRVRTIYNTRGGFDTVCEEGRIDG